uniref:E3 ubiquitin-protein ligase n=1 Tax=Ascaris lumbricoides TaxID=6252 RepID=A0A9J2Q5I1_ASCLU
MPPGDSLNEYDSGSGRLATLASDTDAKMEEQDWETTVMEEARFFKEMSDELKAVGCPLFGGRYCRRLSQENSKVVNGQAAIQIISVNEGSLREKAAVLEDRLDLLLGFESSSISSFRARTRDELRLFIAQGDTLSAFKEKINEGSLREKAAVLEDRLDLLLGFESSSISSFRARTRDELRLFIAQGDTLSAFKEKMKQFDFSLKCNAVWSSDAIAYRCNTCAYNPCMSLCAECFQNSNHQGHDFNRFFSQAGGACDCGNTDVLRESGFCARHGPNAKRPPAPSANIVSLAEFIIPKLFVRLFLYFRGWSRRYDELIEQKKQRASDVNKENFSSHLIAQAHLLIEFMQELVDCGGPIRDAVADILLNESLYADLNKRSASEDLEETSRHVDFSLDWRSRGLLDEDVKSLSAVCGAPPMNYSFDCLLDELVFWMIRLIFPQCMINLCLSMLSHAHYRDWFARRFFSLYACVAEIMVDLAKSEGNATIYAVSSRVIHISVQILSSEAMCLKLDDEIGLKQLLISSTRGLLSVGLQKSYVTQSPLYFYESAPPSQMDEGTFSWDVFSVDVNQPLRKHSYWTLVSDMQNLLGHATIAKRFFRDPTSFDTYAGMIALMQGMNVNFRVVSGDHVEYDTAQPYQLSFHLEWEVAALNMFNTLNALSDEVDCMQIYFRKWKSLMQQFHRMIGTESR